MPAWTWALAGSTGHTMDRPVSPEFSSRFDAETWLGESWRTLAGQGVASVRLLHDGQSVAAALSLPEPGA